MINLNFKKDFDVEYGNSKNELIDEINDKEIEITKENEKVFTDGIDDYYRFSNSL